MSRSFLFNIGNIPSIPAGELIGIKGRAKQGKKPMGIYSYFRNAFRISKGDVMPLQDRYKVLLFDTEQSQASLKKCCQRALKFAGLPTDKNDTSFSPFFHASINH